jgi:hypothetical protein
MGLLIFKDTGRRIIDGRRHALMEYYARCPSGAYLHMNGQTETNDPVWYWKGSASQFNRLAATRELIAVHISELAQSSPPPNEIP